MNTSYRGSVLASALLLMVIIGLFSAAALKASSMLAVMDAQDHREARLLSAAISGLETCRAVMYFGSPGVFAAYGEEGGEPDYPASLPAAPSGEGFILNGCTVTWDVQYINDYTLEVSSRAALDDDAITVFFQVEIPTLAEYSFASNHMGGTGYLGNTDWYGDLYWYSTIKGVPGFAGFQTFHGTLESWAFPTSYDYGTDYEFVDDNLLDAYGNPSVIDEGDAAHLHDAHDFTDPNFQPFDSNVDLGVLFGGGEGSYQDIATASFTSGFSGGVGAMAKVVEIFLGPDGYIYYRQPGQDTDEWTVLTDPATSEKIPQDGAVIYVEKDAVVRGVVTGAITIAAGADIYVNGNIIRADDETSALGLMANDDIYWEVRIENEDAGHGSNDLMKTARDEPGADTMHVHTTGLGEAVNYIAPPVVSEGSTLYEAWWDILVPDPNDADNVAYWTEQFDYWNGEFSGNVPPKTVLEASMYAGDTMGPSVTFWEYVGYYDANNPYISNPDEDWMRHYLDRDMYPDTSWESGGTYFFGAKDHSIWYDYVENWAAITYGEHPNAGTVRPPGFAMLTRGTPDVVPGSFGIIRE